MKRILFTILAVVVSAASFAAPKRIMVYTAEEFIRALGSNREIVIANEEGFLLTPALSDMLESHELKVYDYASRSIQTGIMGEYETDGPQLVISGIKNLTICSKTKGERQSVEVTPRYVNIFTFINCENIVLQDLQLGHTEEGYCSNGVLGFDGCKDVKIENCGLFGCGTEGVVARKSSNFEMNDSEIFRCSYHIMHLNGCDNFKFNNCAFYNNREYEQVNVDGQCTNVEYNKCVFVGNQGLLFNFADQDNVKLKRCIISHSGAISENGIECDENCIWVK